MVSATTQPQTNGYHTPRQAADATQGQKLSRALMENRRLATENATLRSVLTAVRTCVIMRNHRELIDKVLR